jgi:CRP/FNR family cyclic AMP-dependent transcriptional regulator
MDTGGLGKVYQDGKAIVRQGEKGDCMYVILDGQVEIVTEKDGHEMRRAVRNAGDFFGEMAIFEREVRGVTVRALGHVRVFTVDKDNLLSRIRKDPSLAFRMLETMSGHIRSLNVVIGEHEISD